MHAAGERVQGYNQQESGTRQHGLPALEGDVLQALRPARHHPPQQHPVGAVDRQPPAGRRGKAGTRQRAERGSAAGGSYRKRHGARQAGRQKQTMSTDTQPPYTTKLKRNDLCIHPRCNSPRPGRQQLSVLILVPPLLAHGRPLSLGQQGRLVHTHLQLTLSKHAPLPAGRQGRAGRLPACVADQRRLSCSRGVVRAAAAERARQLAGWLAGWPAGRPTCQSLLRWAARAAGRRCHHPEPPCACALQQSRGRGAHAAAEALRESRLDTFLAVSPGASCDSSCAAALCAALQAGKAGSGKSFSARQFASTVQRKLGGQQARQERIAATRRTRQAGRQEGRQGRQK